MTTTKQRRPPVIFALAACLLFLSLGGFAGASSFLTDPSGAGMGMTVDTLKPLMLRDYFLPGLFLLLVFALGSLVVLYGIWAQVKWAWLATGGVSLVLIGWLVGEMLFLKLIAPITIVCLIDGVLILILNALTSVRHYFALN